MQIQPKCEGVSPSCRPPVSSASLSPARPLLTCEGVKGGLGKSTTANCLVAVLERRGLLWSGFDLDVANAQLVRFNREGDVKRFAWNTEKGWDSLFEAVIETDPNRTLLIDLPAQVGQVFDREVPRLDATLRYVQRSHFRLWICAPGYDSVNLLREYGHQVSFERTFAVLNLRNAKREDFTLWDNSNTRRNFLDRGGEEITLPNMPEGLRRALDQESLSLNAAAQHLRHQPWLVADLEAFLAQIDETFDPVIRRFA